MLGVLTNLMNFTTKKDMKTIRCWLSLLMIDIGEESNQYEPMSEMVEKLGIEMGDLK